MSLDRRKTLAVLGGGAILAASGVGYRLTRTPDAALAPWAAAGTYGEPRMRALSYAILAPNPHNRQPWIVDLGTPDQVTLYVDTDRLLPHTDPFSRQIVVGLASDVVNEGQGPDTTPPTLELKIEKISDAKA